MTTASPLLLDQTPSLAATNMRPVQARPRVRASHWPERLALALVAILISVGLFSAGGTDARIGGAMSCGAFLGCTLLTIFSTRDVTTRRIDNRRTMILACLLIAFVLLQAMSGRMQLPLINSQAPRESLLSAIRLAGYLALFVIVRWSVQSRVQARHLMMAAFGAVTFVAALALLRYDPSLDPLNHTGLSGPFANRSAFALMAALGLSIGLAFATQPAHPRAHRPAFFLFRATFILGTALLFVAILHSQSRLGLVSATVAALCVFTMRGAGARAYWIIGAFALFALVSAAGNGVDLSRFSTGGQDTAMRLALYAQVWELIRAAPVFGHGAGSFATLYEAHQSAPVSAALVWDKTHSTALAFLVELGLIFGLLPVICAALTARQLVRQFRANNDAPSLAALAALALVSVHFLGDFSLEFPTNAQGLVIIIALALGPFCLPQKDAKT